MDIECPDIEAVRIGESSFFLLQYPDIRKPLYENIETLVTCEKLPGIPMNVLMATRGTIMTEERARHQPNALAPTG